MSTAVIINLDYARYPAAVCEALWQEICDTLLSNGFRLNGRLFLHSLPPEQALPLVRELMESFEAHLDFHERRFHRFIKEFYGVPAEHLIDLLTSCPREIEVSYGTQDT